LCGEHRGTNLALPQSDNVHNGLGGSGDLREDGMQVMLESASNLDHE